MRKALRFFAVLLAAMFFSLSSWSQNVKLTGRVSSTATGENVANVSVKLKDGSGGTSTDSSGRFELMVPSLPVTLVISSVGYETQEIVVNSTSPVTVNFAPSTIIGQEVVISATRTPQRILEAPVSIERVSAVTIRNSPAPNYYDVVTNLKGVDVVTSSLTFKTPTTRGFSGSGNLRFNQIVDGMDNQAPGLNFSVGSVIGLTELDVESMELLPGASSALYGPGGMNGTLLINSKNPFRYQGLSYQIKTGVMNINSKERDVSPYYNWSLRWAQKVSDRFAFKIGTELIKATDWVAHDYRDYRRFGTTGSIVDGTRDTDPNYDGVNVYGDEVPDQVPTFRNVLASFASQFPPGGDFIRNVLIPETPEGMKISRTGYTENEVVNPTTLNYKLSGAVHYKINPDLEAVVAGHWGTGNTVYTGSQRYSLKDLKIGQYKVELNAKNWFVRAYTTQENAGESHNLTVTSQLFNEAWRPTASWMPIYALNYYIARSAGVPYTQAHNAARAVADVGRPAAGSAQFKRIFDSVRKVPIPNGGLFLDRSDLYMTEGQYNFGNKIQFAEVIVGGNWKQYVLNSEGTLFADKKDSAIKINEYGAYAQASKEVLKDRLRITASVRYDKNENFKGRFTPRLTAVIKPAPDHNIRVSIQSAYRFPSTQQQWIDLNVGTGRLLGGNIALWEKYNLINNPGYAADILTTPSHQERIPYQEVKPESVTSVEVGYKALLDRKLLLDVYTYYGSYQDFITRRDVVQFAGGTPGTGVPYNGYSIVVNSPEQVKTYGGGASAEYLLPGSYVVSGSISSDRISDVPAGFRAFFNAPELRTVLTVANTGFGPNKNLSANVSWRWQEGFFYENDFTQGDLPGFHTIDAAFNFKAPKIKSLFKIGASNLLNQYYRTALGNPSVGGLYYVTFAYNVL